MKILTTLLMVMIFCSPEIKVLDGRVIPKAPIHSQNVDLWSLAEKAFKNVPLHRTVAPGENFLQTVGLQRHPTPHRYSPDGNKNSYPVKKLVESLPAVLTAVRAQNVESSDEARDDSIKTGKLLPLNQEGIVKDVEDDREKSVMTAANTSRVSEAIDPRAKRNRMQIRAMHALPAMKNHGRKPGRPGCVSFVRTHHPNDTHPSDSMEIIGISMHSMKLTLGNVSYTKDNLYRNHSNDEAQDQVIDHSSLSNFAPSFGRHWILGSNNDHHDHHDHHDRHDHHDHRDHHDHHDHHEHHDRAHGVKHQESSDDKETTTRHRRIRPLLSGDYRSTCSTTTCSRTPSTCSTTPSTCSTTRSTCSTTCSTTPSTCSTTTTCPTTTTTCTTTPSTCSTTPSTCSTTTTCPTTTTTCTTTCSTTKTCPTTCSTEKTCPTTCSTTKTCPTTCSTTKTCPTTCSTTQACPTTCSTAKTCPTTCPTICPTTRCCPKTPARTCCTTCPIPCRYNQPPPGFQIWPVQSTPYPILQYPQFMPAMPPCFPANGMPPVTTVANGALTRAGMYPNMTNDFGMQPGSGVGGANANTNGQFGNTMGPNPNPTVANVTNAATNAVTSAAPSDAGGGTTAAATNDATSGPSDGGGDSGGAGDGDGGGGILTGNENVGTPKPIGKFGFKKKGTNLNAANAASGKPKHAKSPKNSFVPAQVVKPVGSVKTVPVKSAAKKIGSYGILADKSAVRTAEHKSDRKAGANVLKVLISGPPNITRAFLVPMNVVESDLTKLKNLNLLTALSEDDSYNEDTVKRLTIPAFNVHSAQNQKIPGRSVIKSKSRRGSTGIRKDIVEEDDDYDGEMYNLVKGKLLGTKIHDNKHKKDPLKDTSYDSETYGGEYEDDLA